MLADQYDTDSQHSQSDNEETNQEYLEVATTKQASIKMNFAKNFKSNVAKNDITGLKTAIRT